MLTVRCGFCVSSRESFIREAFLIKQGLLRRAPGALVPLVFIQQTHITAQLKIVDPFE